MNKRYHLEYEESQQTFSDMYQLFYDSRSLYMYRLIVTLAGFLMLAIKLSVSRAMFTLPYIVKFLVLWGLAYVAGYLAVKYIIRKIDGQNAQTRAESSYRLRVEKCGVELHTSIDFYEDKFTVTFQDKKEEYTYKEVSRMLRSERFFGLVVGGVYGEKQMVGFPAASLAGIDKEAFMKYMTEKCTNVAGGFRKYWC